MTLKVIIWTVKGMPALLIRPWLWRTVAKQMAWPPWKSLPWFRFRYETAYGSSVGDPGDLLRFMQWARAANRFAKNRPERDFGYPKI